MIRNQISRTISQIEYETIKSLELAHSTQFTEKEIINILKNIRNLK